MSGRRPWFRSPPPSHHARSHPLLPSPRALLEPIKAKFPWISYADLYTLAGATAIEAMGGAHLRLGTGVRQRLRSGAVLQRLGPGSKQHASGARGVVPSACARLFPPPKGR